MQRRKEKLFCELAAERNLPGVTVGFDYWIPQVEAGGVFCAPGSEAHPIFRAGLNRGAWVCGVIPRVKGIVSMSQSGLAMADPGHAVQLDLTMVPGCWRGVDCFAALAMTCRLWRKDYECICQGSRC